MVATPVVVVFAVSVSTVCPIPDIRKCFHRLWFFPVKAVDEVRFSVLAVVNFSSFGDPESLEKLVFVSGKDVAEVSDALKIVAVRTEVEVDSASALATRFRPSRFQGFNDCLKKR